MLPISPYHSSRAALSTRPLEPQQREPLGDRSPESLDGTSYGFGQAKHFEIEQVFALAAAMLAEL